MKSWKEENPVVYEKTQISIEIRKLQRSNDPEKDSKIEALRERYKDLDKPRAEKRKEQFSNFLKRFGK
jgi:hypothetical protein